mmetsp:Transcript_132880/g.384191  ORF Transcript_132880/g.384191 Transcript_132880/m.384191 type:complete len:272 (-) Transcript_132880:1022-1837(-)
MPVQQEHLQLVLPARDRDRWIEGHYRQLHQDHQVRIRLRRGPPNDQRCRPLLHAAYHGFASAADGNLKHWHGRGHVSSRAGLAALAPCRGSVRVGGVAGVHLHVLGEDPSTPIDLHQFRGVFARVPHLRRLDVVGRISAGRRGDIRSALSDRGLAAGLERNERRRVFPQHRAQDGGHRDLHHVVGNRLVDRDRRLLLEALDRYRRLHARSDFGVLAGHAHHAGAATDRRGSADGVSGGCIHRLGLDGLYWRCGEGGCPRVCARRLCQNIYL